MKSQEVKIDFAVGGQAVLEGVMMRSPRFYTVSVRDEKGEIQMQQKPFISLTERRPWLNVPLIRGMVHMVESMVLGYRSLDFSNEVLMGEPEKEAPDSKWTTLFLGVFSVLTIVLSLGLSIAMLKVLPLFVAEQAAKLWPVVQEHYVLFNLIDGATKIALFIGYIGFLSLFKDIRRVFQYHGAEHKSIWTYELGLPLDVENARAQTRFHPRCGTSFIFIVILMSIVIYTIVPPADGFWGKLLERLAVIPLIAGSSYELLKWSAKHQKNVLVRLFVWPGLMIQRLTTREPDDSQLEVALHSLKASLNGNS